MAFCTASSLAGAQSGAQGQAITPPPTEAEEQAAQELLAQQAQEEQNIIGPVHGIAIHGDVKYGPDFTHLDYVNPDAPKGGVLRQHVIGTFDS